MDETETTPTETPAIAEVPAKKKTAQKKSAKKSKKTNSALQGTKATQKKKPEPKPEDPKVAAARMKLEALGMLSAGHFDFDNLTDFLSGRMGGKQKFINGRWEQLPVLIFEVTSAEAAELGQILALELQLSERRAAFTDRLRSELKVGLR